MHPITIRTVLALAVLLSVSTPAAAQEREVPYWASLRAEEVNMRVGPSPNFPIEWVYRRVGLPVKVHRLMQGWRLVEEPDGTRGWIVARLLTRERTAIVTGASVVPMRTEPTQGSPLKWNVEPGVTGQLGECEGGWCRFDVNGHEGWILAEHLWGDGEP